MPFSQFLLALITLIAPGAFALYRKAPYWWAPAAASLPLAAIIFSLDPVKHAEDWYYTAIFPAFLLMWAGQLDSRRKPSDH